MVVVIGKEYRRGLCKNSVVVLQDVPVKKCTRGVGMTVVPKRVLCVQVTCYDKLITTVCESWDVANGK